MMKIWMLVFVVATLCWAPRRTNAADIVWVHQSRGMHLSAWEDDQWGEFLLDSGHQIIEHQPFDVMESLVDSTDQIELLNSGDLVIFSRDSLSGDYSGSEDEILIWTAGVQTPMIIMTPYVVRDSRWRMVNGSALGDALEPMEVLNTSHPFFDGVSLDGDNQVEVWDDQIFGPDDNIDILQVADVGDGEVLAVEAGTQNPWIIHWPDPESEFYPGSGTFAGEQRVFFGLGSDDDPNSWGGKNTTPEADQILLNIIDFLVPPDESTPCDFNVDGVCDIVDLDALLYNGLVNNESTYDLNGDGTVDLLDRDAFLSEISSFPGDFDLDGKVVAGDLNTLGGSWQQSGLTSYGQGDANGDGIANASDLNAVGSHWQAGAEAAAAVPEPSGYRLTMVCGLIGLMLRRQTYASSHKF